MDVFMMYETTTLSEKGGAGSPHRWRLAEVQEQQSCSDQFFYQPAAKTIYNQTL